MPSPRRQRDFSNINNMGKKKNLKKNKGEPRPKNTTDAPMDLDAYRKKEQDKRLSQLMNGTAENPSDIVFQDTDTFQNGVQTLRAIGVKNQQSAPASQAKLPIMRGTDSAEVKSSRFRLYNGNANRGRFDNALKKELNHTKDALKKNKQQSSLKATVEQQEKETVRQKKQAAAERSAERIAQKKQSDDEAVYEEHLATPIVVEKPSIPTVELPSITEDIPQNRAEIEQLPPTPLPEDETADMAEKGLEIKPRPKSIESRQKPVHSGKKRVKAGLLRSLLSKIRSMLLRSKTRDSSLILVEENPPLSPDKVEKIRTSSQSEAAVLVSVSEIKKEQDGAGSILQQPEEISDATTNQPLEVEEKSEPELVDPLHHLRSQKPVFQGVIRTLLRESENPVRQMEAILSERNEEFNAADIKSLIDYVATPWALMYEINYQPRLKIYEGFTRGEGTHLSNHESLLESIIQAREVSFDRELLDILFKALANCVTLGDAEVTEIIDDFADAYPKNHHIVVLSHILGRTSEILGDWPTHPSVGNYEDECVDRMHYMKMKFSQEAILLASEVFSAFALEYPGKIKSQFSLRKHKYAAKFELKVERWVKQHLPEQEFITQTELKRFKEKEFGIHTFRGQNRKKPLQNTPDILFAAPVSLEGHETKVLWIDAKLAMYDPAFTEEKRMKKLFGQMEKYVKEYGPGLMVWGKPFSEEWNEHTQPAVVHTTMEAMG